MEGDTGPLRSAAAHWSLSGDSQLLSVLQSLHQTIITKCQETNTALDVMVNALDNASIDLQNVNNKFMALSNNQFVESRVYEDEVELTDNNIKQESPKPEAQSSLSSLKLGLRVLESLHEVVSIVDSDSEDEGQSPRRVLRPSCSRPRLPHIIGSQAWRDSTHAGLSDADSDDSADKGASAPEYSDSDTDQHIASSSSLSSMTSHALPPPVTSHTPSGQDVRTEKQYPEPELQESPQPRKLYTVDKPIPAQIFSDEPPPLDGFESDSDDDIFAELHRPYPNSNKSHNVVDELFGSGPYVNSNRDDSDIGNIVNTVARESSPLFSRAVEAESKEAARETYTEPGVKKPVGGISLFGSKGSKSIGAAILKRNQKQSSSESDATETPTKKHNIIEDLFTKPVKNVKKQPANDKSEPVKEINDKILFNDNIFDDIDDIFTSNVITATKDKDETLFDDDLFEADKNDNLFKDKIKDKDNKPHKSKEIKEKVKSIFDSDSEDDLFSDVKLKDDLKAKEHTNDKIVNVNKHTQPYTDREKSSELKVPKTEVKVDNLKQLSPNIFDDDDDDDLFGDKIQPKKNSHSKTEIAGNINDEIQNSNDKEDDSKSEITSNEKIQITDGESKNLREEDEKINEKYVSDNKNTDLNINYNVNNDIKEPELEKEDIKKPSVMKNYELDITANSAPKLPALPEIDFIEEARTSKEDIERVIEESHSKDIFVDIFSDLPPAFEKPIESKKSKNVNALFDDDSDDEALFFKKDDAITDEKPDLEYKSDRFQIFHDEPPDIDVDFSQKLRNTTQYKIPDNLSLPDEDNNIIVEKLIENNAKEDNSLPKSKNPTERETNTEDLRSENKQNIDNVNSNSNTKYEQKTDILKLLESERDEDIFKENKDIEEDIFSDQKNDSNETSKSDDKIYTNKDDTDSSGSEKRPVGKLRPMAININVKSLLPGAVPKKSSPGAINEETDGQTTSRRHEPSQDNTKPEMAAVSIKGNSEVLDNKLSKERAKIQVKRRPSTRRARLEAVRKSGIDFGSDSTDNSSSFDEPVKEKLENDKISVPYKKLKDETKLKSEVKESHTEIKEVTSKVVYILNDEDIFEVPAKADADTNIADDLIKQTCKGNENNTNENNPSKDKKQTLIDTVSEKQVHKFDKTKKSLFDDMSDDDTELFKKPVQKSVFDSDSESELFSGKIDKVKRESGLKVEQKLKETKVDEKVKERKVEKKVTKPLFSDDSDEDLFGGKTRKTEVKDTPQPRPSSTKTSQTFEDPLSMLGHDEI